MGEQVLGLAVGGKEPGSLTTGGDEGVALTDGSQLSATPRQRVRDLLGMWGVSEPAALLAASSRELIVPRVKTPRATMAVARLVVGDSPTVFAIFSPGPEGDPA